MLTEPLNITNAMLGNLDFIRTDNINFNAGGLRDAGSEWEVFIRVDNYQAEIIVRAECWSENCNDS